MTTIKPVAGVLHNLPPLPSPEYDRCETASGVRLFSEDQMCDFAREHEVAVTTRLAEAAPEANVAGGKQLREIIGDYLAALYVCNRVWEAWSVGTMTEDDFVLASETEFVEELAQAIEGASTPPAPTQHTAPVGYRFKARLWVSGNTFEEKWTFSEHWREGCEPMFAASTPQPAVQADPAGAGNLPDPGAAHRNAIEESTLEFDAFVNGKTVKWWQQEKFAVALAAFEAGRALAASAGAVKALPGAG